MASSTNNGDDQNPTHNVTSPESSLDDSNIVPDESSAGIKTTRPTDDDATETSSKKPISDEFSRLNISQEKGESSTGIIRVSEASIRNMPISDLVDSWGFEDANPDDFLGEDSDSQPSPRPIPCDFGMVVRPPSVLKRAIDALSEKHFNAGQKALITVGADGFEITVSSTAMDDRLVVSALRLMANGLEDFTCFKPMSKMVSLKGLSNLFKAAENFNKPSESVAVYSEEGSNKLSFHWGRTPLDFALGFPVNIEMKDAEPDSDEFPEVSYTFKAVTPSELMRAMITAVMNSSGNRPGHVDLTLRTSSVAQMTVNNVVSSSEMKPEAYEVRLIFKFWESLWHAAHLADKCTVYLVSDPYQAMVLQFDLEELGDMVFLSDMEFLREGRAIAVPDLPIIGCLPGLN